MISLACMCVRVCLLVCLLPCLSTLCRCIEKNIIINKAYTCLGRFMFKLVKYAIITNLVLSLLYVLSSLYLWDVVNRWLGGGSGSMWSAFYITLYPLSENWHMVPIVPVVNVPFWLFWVTIAINMYFIIKLQKSSKEVTS
jgi:hypothetical protein